MRKRIAQYKSLEKANHQIGELEMRLYRADEDWRERVNELENQVAIERNGAMMAIEETKRERERRVLLEESRDRLIGQLQDYDLRTRGAKQAIRHAIEQVQLEMNAAVGAFSEPQLDDAQARVDAQALLVSALKLIVPEVQA